MIIAPSNKIGPAALQCPSKPVVEGPFCLLPLTSTAKPSFACLDASEGHFVTKDLPLGEKL